MFYLWTRREYECVHIHDAYPHVDTSGLTHESQKSPTYAQKSPTYTYKSPIFSYPHVDELGLTYECIMNNSCVTYEHVIN